MKTKFKLMLLMGVILISILLLSTTNVKAFVEDGSGIVTSGTVTEEVIQNLPDTIYVDISEVEFEKVDEAVCQKVIATLKGQGIVIEKKDYTEYKDGDVKLEIYKDYLDINKATVNFRQIGTDWENQIGQKEVTVVYNNHDKYNEADKRYIEEALTEVGFSNGTYHINDYQELDGKYDFSKQEEIIKKMNDFGVVMIVKGAAGGPEVLSDYSAGVCHCFKDGVYYGRLAGIIVDTQYKITVPYHIPTTQQDYINYAIPKLQKHVNETSLLSEEEKGTVTLQKQSGDRDIYKVYSAGNYIGNILLIRGEKPQVTEPPVVKPVITNIKKCAIANIANQNYTGKAVKPSVTIKNGKTTLKNGTDYTVSYKNNINLGIAIVTITGKGNYTGTITKTFKIVVGQVKNVTAKSQDTKSITVKWNKPSGSITGYEVYMATSKNGKYKKVATITKNSTTTYKKTKLSSGKNYYFKVRAYKTIKKKKNYGAYSSILGAATKTKTPSISKATAGNYKITLKWKKVSGASGYEIYMATSKNGKYSKIKTITKGSTTSYTKTGLKGGKTYYFKIRAYKTVAGKKLYSGYSSKKGSKAKEVKGVKINTVYNNKSYYPVKLTFTSKKKFKWQNKRELTSGPWVTTFTGTYTAKGNKVTVKMKENGGEKKYLVIDNSNNTFWLDPKIYTNDSI